MLQNGNGTTKSQAIIRVLEVHAASVGRSDVLKGIGDGGALYASDLIWVCEMFGLDPVRVFACEPS